MKKKLFALALSLIMLLGVLSAFPVMATEGTQQSYTDVVTMTALYNGTKKPVAGAVYSISSVDELFYFTELCNHGNMYFDNATVVLTDNITMNEGWTAGATAPTGENAKTWTPIDCFMGTFDGQNHTISGFYQTSGKNWKAVKYDAAGNSQSGTEMAGGIFCTAGGEGLTVKNLNIDNSYFCSAANSSALIGVILNKTSNKNTRIENVHINATVKSTSGEAAGIIAMTHGTNRTENIYIDNCTVRGTVTSARRAGGLVGAAYMMVNFNNCVNYATVSTSSAAYPEIGGIVGVVNCGGGSLVMTSCVNRGNISVTGSITDTGNNVGIGGLVGHCNQPSTYTDCVSTGNVTVTNVRSGNGVIYIGGLIGSIKNAQTHTLRRCAGLGNVSATTDSTNNKTYVCVGGLIGNADNASSVLNLYDCVYSGSLSSGNNVSGGLVGAYVGINSNFERCLFNGTTTYASAYTGAFIGIAHLNPAAADKNIYFTDCYHTSAYANTLGSYYTTAGRAWKISVSVTGKESIELNHTTTGEYTNNRDVMNAPFDTLGCTAFNTAQLSDLNAIKNLTAFDWANTTENGWKIEKVGNKYLPLPTSVAALVATDMTEKDNGVDYDGIQIATDKSSVRFVATVDKDIDCDAIGFEVLVIKNGEHATTTLETSTVYESLRYTDVTKPEGDQSAVYTVDGKYLAALAFEGIDPADTVTFVVKTYSKTGEDVSYDDICVSTVKNGNVFTYYR